MRFLTIVVSSLGAACLAAPLCATPLPIGSSNIALSAFDPTTQGSELAWEEVLGTALTFTGDLRAAVYRNTLGTLDFYYQVQRTGGGLIGSDDIRSMTAANFLNFTADAMFSNADLDGAGIFAAANNGGGIGTANRNSGGGVIGVSLGTTEALSGTETSATYVFRTNATNFSELGTFGVSDGSTFSGRAFQPAAVPEVASWALILVGFGGIGSVMRRKNGTSSYA